ncbi:MarR family transcriptional regulator [Amycolatopsis jejuensis]|uniref:MarR family transcriptional regulator n=1 Tax=Amycolatopsis jejuensis TaxID=330084 RepID=UPI00052555CB|nr:MarR family transcriptional regulator [Amycolatopsis jejuensis]
MVVQCTPADLDLSLVAVFAGWAMADEVQRRMVAERFGELRFNDGVVIQHVVAGPVSITAIAERMGVSQQAASKAVADLERRGVLTRRKSPEDARAWLVHLTEYGENAVRAARVHRADLDAELADDFGADRVAAAREVLAAVVTRFGAADAVRHRRVRPAH